MGENEQKSNLIYKVMVPVIVMIVSGGSAPWWWPALFSHKPASPATIASSAASSPEIPKALPTVDAAFERRKQATLKAWDQMQDGDSAYGGPSSEAFQRLSYSYEQIDVSKVDPVLVTHIKESVVLYRESMNAYKAYEDEATRIQQASMSEQEKQNAFQLLQSKYQLNKIFQKLEGINDRDKTLARLFSEKYDVPFVDR